MRFENDSSSYPTVTVTGPPPNTPADLSVGKWTAALGYGESYDTMQPDSGTVRCLREFEITPDTHSVTIAANFRDDWSCELELMIDPPPPVAAQPGRVKIWTPSTVGVMDNCQTRLAILRVDPDNRAWYEEIDTGKRIEIADPGFAEFNVDYEGGQANISGPDGSQVMAAGDIVYLNCVIQDGDISWYGGANVAWSPWERALGSSAADNAKYLLEWVRGHAGGAPPAAATIQSALSGDLDEAALRALDAEIGSGNAGFWSAAVPGVFVGNRNALSVALDAQDLPSEIDEWEWLSLPEYAGSQRVRHYVTPAGNTVWAIGERLNIWNDCSQLIAPQLRSDGVDAVESSLDIEGGIADVRIFGDGGSDTQVVVDYRDAACQAHEVIGPILAQLLGDVETAPSPMPTAPPRYDFVGKLQRSPKGCAVFVDADGISREIYLQFDSVLIEDPVPQIRNPDGSVAASEGDTVAVNGWIERGSGTCASEQVVVNRLVSVKPPHPAATPTPTPNPVAQACSASMLPMLLDEHEDTVVSIFEIATGLLTISVWSDSDDLNTRDEIVVDPADPACRADPLVGPIIAGAIDGFGSQPSAYRDRVGRLIVADPARQCTSLWVADGWTFNLVWPEGYEVTANGVLDSRGRLAAEGGDLIRVQGRERREIPGACVEDWSIRVREATLLG